MRLPWESAKAALRKRLRGMINELSDLMPEDDTRWPAFGLNVPGETQAPEAVTDVQVEPAGAGRLRVEFEDSARSDRYQIEIQIVGTDLNYRRVVTVRDSSAEIGPLPVSARVKVRVVAANDAGESSPSEAVEAVVPALSEAA